MNAPQQVFEFRGVDSLYVAEVTQDDANGYVCGTPMYLAPVAEVGKTTDSSSEAHYYDNKAMIVINSESADTITITMAPPELAKLSQIIGKSFDATTGMMVDSPRQNKYFALMYRTKGTDGKYRYVSRLKGQFTIPDETSATENEGTDANNSSVTYTGIYTEHEFTKGSYNGVSWEKSGAKGIVVDTRYGLADVSTFFEQVQTPDTIQTLGNQIVLSADTATVAAGNSTSVGVVVNTTGETLTLTSSDPEVATVSSGYQGNSIVISGVSAGEATITASAHGSSPAYVSATIAVTVTE